MRYRYTASSEAFAQEPGEDNSWTVEHINGGQVLQSQDTMTETRGAARLVQIWRGAPDDHVLTAQGIGEDFRTPPLPLRNSPSTPNSPVIASSQNGDMLICVRTADNTLWFLDMGPNLNYGNWQHESQREATAVAPSLSVTPQNRFYAILASAILGIVAYKQAFDGS